MVCRQCAARLLSVMVRPSRRLARRLRAATAVGEISGTGRRIGRARAATKLLYALAVSNEQVRMTELSTLVRAPMPGSVLLAPHQLCAGRSFDSCRRCALKTHARALPSTSRAVKYFGVVSSKTARCRTAPANNQHPPAVISVCQCRQTGARGGGLIVRQQVNHAL